MRDELWTSSGVPVNLVSWNIVTYTSVTLQLPLPVAREFTNSIQFWHWRFPTCSLLSPRFCILCNTTQGDNDHNIDASTSRSISTNTHFNHLPFWYLHMVCRMVLPFEVSLLAHKLSFEPSAPFCHLLPEPLQPWTRTFYKSSPPSVIGASTRENKIIGHHWNWDVCAIITLEGTRSSNSLHEGIDVALNVDRDIEVTDATTNSESIEEVGDALAKLSEDDKIPRVHPALWLAPDGQAVVETLVRCQWYCAV